MKKKRNKSYLKVRVAMVMVLFLAFFSAILFRAFQLQVLDAPRLKRMAANQHNKTLNIQSKRGGIYDRNLRELAVSIDVDSIYAQPARVRNPRAEARRLAPILQVSAGSIERKLRSKKSFVWLRRQVDLKDIEREKIKETAGVGIIKESRRYYPNRALASNLIGFTGVDSVGLEGVELYYNDLLSGLSRKVIGGRDARGSTILFGDTDREVPLEGMKVELTIDKTIQYIAEKALKRAVEASGAKGGMAVVMSPATGEVLAMASMPTFDPNRFKRYSSRFWRNRAVTDVFEPGSVLKVFTVAGALEEGVVKPRDIFYCENGSYRVADRVFHDAEKHGWLSVAQIVKYSSNIGALKVAEKLGQERLYRHLQNFGFGARTGLDLPGESAGVLRDYRDWSGVTLQTVSFGQGISTTAIQLVSAVSAVANGGFLMKPYIVRRIKAAGGDVVKENNPVIVRRVLSGKTAGTVTQILTSVTSPDGTGRRAAIRGFLVAGKTATAQKPDTKRGGYKKGAFMASFLGFVPARSPALAILVTIDEPSGKQYHGGSVAAPAFREIATRGLSYLGVFPDRPASAGVKLVSSGGNPIKTPDYKRVVRDDGQARLVPDFRGKTVRKVLRMAMNRTIEVDVKGGGVAVRQKPVPGSRIRKDRAVAVWFQ